jgi:hypothetical protein
LLDFMPEFNKIQPIFFWLNPKQQLAGGNAVMWLIQAHTDSPTGPRPDRPLA